MFIRSKEDAKEYHLQLLEQLQHELGQGKAQAFYTDGSKEGNHNAAGACQIINDNKICFATNWYLGESLEIMDAELFAIQKVLQKI